ncbi:ribosome hibernation-promoting factor, HPF/YfiA family [Thalassotalea fusca]
MKVKFSGHHVVVTQAIEQFTLKKLTKMSSHFPQLSIINAVIRIDAQGQAISLSTQFEGNSVKVSARDKNLYTAIGLVVKKLESGLTRKKGQLAKKLHQKYVVAQSDLYDAA